LDHATKAYNMNRAIQQEPPTNPTAAAGKAAAPSRAEAIILPIKPSKDTKLPGGHIVSTGIDCRTGRPGVNVVVDPPNGAKVMGGSDWSVFNEVLLETVLATIPTKNTDAVPNRIVAAGAALAAFRPTDEVEAMLAAQAVGMHQGSMECLRRSLLPGQDAEVASRLRKGRREPGTCGGRHARRIGSEARQRPAGRPGRARGRP
jgi:hypothetical protein